jgi:hypothetical protein
VSLLLPLTVVALELLEDSAVVVVLVSVVLPPLLLSATLLELSAPPLLLLPPLLSATVLLPEVSSVVTEVPSELLDPLLLEPPVTWVPSSLHAASAQTSSGQRRGRIALTCS